MGRFLLYFDLVCGRGCGGEGTAPRVGAREAPAAGRRHRTQVPPTSPVIAGRGPTPLLHFNISSAGMRRLAAATALLMCTLSCAATWRIPNSGGRGPARRLAQTDAWATDQDLWGEVGTNDVAQSRENDSTRTCLCLQHLLEMQLAPCEAPLPLAAHRKHAGPSCHPTPAGCPFAEGDVVYCNKTGHPRFGQVVRVENGTLHVYPSRESWEYDGSPQPTEASEEACDKLDNCPEGEPMPEEDLLPAPERGGAASLPRFEGQGLALGAQRRSGARCACSLLCVWTLHVAVNCRRLPSCLHGAEYTAAPQVPSPQQPVQSCPLPEGSVVACLDNTAGGIGIGRVEGGRVRWYPTDEAYKADGSPAIGYSSSTTTCSMVRQCGDGLPMPAPGGCRRREGGHRVGGGMTMTGPPVAAAAAADAVQGAWTHCMGRLRCADLQSQHVGLLTLPPVHPLPLPSVPLQERRCRALHHHRRHR